MKNKNIVQSSVEPNKEDLWFNKGDIKYYGSKGWKSITDTVESESLEGKVATLENSVKTNTASIKANTDALATKVDKDGYIAYTQDEKTKLAGLKNYTLPVASASALGGIKIGTGLTIKDGIVSATGTSSLAWTAITDKPTFATVATSGSYNDLDDKPTIPAAQVQSDWNATTGLGVIKNKPTNLVTTTALTTALAKKVDAVEGKGLSTNDYTAAEKTKLSGIATGATKNTTMTAATASAAGTGGLVPAPAAGKQSSYLRGDGTWAVPTDTKYTLPAASAAALGGVKAGAAIADVAADAELTAVVTAFNTLLANLRTAGIILKA